MSVSLNKVAQLAGSRKLASSTSTSKSKLAVSRETQLGRGKLASRVSVKLRTSDRRVIVIPLGRERKQASERRRLISQIPARFVVLQRGALQIGADDNILYLFSRCCFRRASSFERVSSRLRRTNEKSNENGRVGGRRTRKLGDD